jgi:hypothetical protein
VTEYASDSTRELLRQRNINISYHFGRPASYMLLTNVFVPEGTLGHGMLEGSTINEMVVTALRLHSSAGLPVHESYFFCCPAPPHQGLMSRPPYSAQARNSHLGAGSELRRTDFPVCLATIDRLLTKTWNQQSTSDRVLALAMDYHRLSFTLERVDHAFLILMVAFEAMFKRDYTERAAEAAIRIGRLLGATQSECGTIQRAFVEAGIHGTFSDIRNAIAHGDTSLNPATVANQYPLLYRYLTRAIVVLLNLAPGEIDDTQPYYDEISRWTNDRYNLLPP